MDSHEQIGQRSSNQRLARTFAVSSVAFILSIVLLSSGDLLEIIPGAAAISSSPVFPFFHEIHDLLVVGLIIDVAHKKHYRLAITGTAIFAIIHIPYFLLGFPENSPELLRIVFSILVSIFGVVIIRRMYQSEEHNEAVRDTLSQSEEKYRDLYDGAPIAYFSVSADGLVKESNQAAQSFVGYSRDELHSKNRLELYAPESVEKSKLLFDLLRNGTLVQNEEMVYRKKDGSKIIGLLSMSPVINHDGQVVSMRGVVKDITDKKHDEQKILHLNETLQAIRSVNQLIAHEDNRRALIQNTCDLLVKRRGYKNVWIMLLDQKNECSEVAGAGFDPDLKMFLQYLEKHVFPECLQKLFASNTPFIVFEHPGHQHRCILAGQHSGQCTYRCKLAHAGKVYGVFGVSLPSEKAFDTEEQKLLGELCDDIAFAIAKIESLQQQCETEKRYRTILQTATDGFWLVDERGCFIEVNEAYCRLTGYSREEMIEKNISNVEAIETTEETANRIKRIKEQGESVFETKHRCKDGRFISLEVTAKYMSSEKLLFVFLHDITARKKLQQQLMAQDRLASIGQLVSGIAHEINNPMTSVVGFSELLLEKNLPDDIKGDLKIINDEANRTTRIVRDLLTFARKQPENKDPIDVNEQIKKVLELRNYEQKVNNIKVVSNFSKVLPVIANASQLQQVFFNIIVNAEFFMLKAHNSGVLSIKTEQIGDFVRASFSDNGEGISNANMSQIFTPFFTTREVGKGTGLGLSICHGIITEHGGRIYAESELGKGATFVIELPCHIQPAG